MAVTLPYEYGACFPSLPTPGSLLPSYQLHMLILPACLSSVTPLQTNSYPRDMPWDQTHQLLAHPLEGRGHTGPGSEPLAKWAGNSGVLGA